MITRTPLFVVALLIGCIGMSPAFSQEINTPTHFPNSAANKLTHARLKALVAKSIAEEGAKDEIRRLQARDFDRDGCSINIGNTKIVSPGSRVDRDVIIDGDIINACR